MKRIALFFLMLFPGRLWAEVPHIQPSQDVSMPSRILSLDSVADLPKPVQPRPWHVYAAPGVTFDQNINHLLINSTVNSNIRVADTIIHTEAGATYRPDWWDRAKPYFSYTFERQDYQDHDGFSYFDHKLYGEYDYWFTKRWALDTGIEATWYGDREGLVTDDQIGHVGGRWRYRRYRLRAGYSLRRAQFIYSPGKAAFANSGYIEISRGFWKSQTVYAYYDFRRSRANDPIYSYRSHFVEAGWVNTWSRRLRVTWIGSYVDKPYQSFDRRFGDRRHDRTFSLTAKPSVAIYPNLKVIGAYTYSQNDSNVDLKKYADSLYSLSLEARF